MKTLFHEKSLVDYARPENILFSLGIEDESVGQEVLSSRLLAPVIETMLVPPMDDEEEHSEHLEYVIEKMLECDVDTYHAVSRIVAVLTQTWHFAHSSDGKLLRLAAEFAGEKEIVQVMRMFDLPWIETLPPLETLDEENLEMMATLCYGFMLGLLPKPYLVRLAFMHPREAIPRPLDFKDREKDVELFTAMVGAAFYLLTEEDSDGEEEADEAN